MAAPYQSSLSESIEFITFRFRIKQQFNMIMVCIRNRTNAHFIELIVTIRDIYLHTIELTLIGLNFKWQFYIFIYGQLGNGHPVDT